MVLIQERKRCESIRNQFIKLQSQLKEREDYAKDQASGKAELVLMQRQALEENLKVLTLAGDLRVCMWCLN